ncbi:hypothetical protein GJ496_001711 [Pomphorhynchus laevis]|nr:hypothetical protein GJ496_001711 [Pomphorhynchus laevis]
MRCVDDQNHNISAKCDYYQNRSYSWCIVQSDGLHWDYCAEYKNPVALLKSSATGRAASIDWSIQSFGNNPFFGSDECELCYALTLSPTIDGKRDPINTITYPCHSKLPLMCKRGIYSVHHQFTL